jgi:two-component system LytT family response regulator
MKRVRCVIVDDEPLGRQALRIGIGEVPQFDLVGEASGGEEAVEVIRRLEPDVVFLDVQMPEVDGFDVVAALDAASLPVIVFVTAHDAYATRAFEANAVDYILKPFDHVRFHRAAERAMRHVLTEERAEYAERLDRVVTARCRRVPVRSAGQILLIDPEQIDWIEASGNYLRLHMGSEDHEVRSTFEAFQPKVAAYPFQRIHRSVMVNLDRVAKLEAWSTGEYVVRMTSGRELTLSRKYKDEFFRRIDEAPPPPARTEREAWAVG